eukprot:5026639-Amphidinium_carterae.1
MACSERRRVRATVREQLRKGQQTGADRRMYLRQLEGRQHFTHMQVATERMPELEERTHVLRVSGSSCSYLTSSAEMARVLEHH